MDGQDVPPTLKLRATPEEARRMPTDPGRATALLMGHGTMGLRWFAPTGHDPQTPHDRDELYVVVSGTGVFMRAQDSHPLGDDLSLPLMGEDRVTFSPGDAIFVPAGTEHRFESFSDDFACWIVFYGPEGGEGHEDRGFTAASAGSAALG
jgi:mannose-6-phosphate isomerase-like protein (cupin superfamily)